MILSRYFGTETTPIENVRPTVWNTAAGFPDGDKDRAATLEQYKLYVEMADRISARRGLTNTLFLTLNTAIFAAIGALWKGRRPAAGGGGGREGAPRDRPARGVHGGRRADRRGQRDNLRGPASGRNAGVPGAGG